MGTRNYALRMAKLLDPDAEYFHSRVISRHDCRDSTRKSLDRFLGQERAVVILDDTEEVWKEHKNNLILMKKYDYFSQPTTDESESNGALASILRVLQRIHSKFFDQEHDLEGQDVRQVLQSFRKQVLEGCKIVLCIDCKDGYLRKVAEELGASCSAQGEVDQSVTHVVSLSTRRYKSVWAMKEKKFLVHPSWILETNYFWLKQPEENFPPVLIT